MRIFQETVSIFFGTQTVLRVLRRCPVGPTRAITSPELAGLPKRQAAQLRRLSFPFLSSFPCVACAVKVRSAQSLYVLSVVIQPCCT